VSLSDEDIERIAQRTAQIILAARVTEPAPTNRLVFLHSLPLEEFAACVDHHPESLRKMIRANDRRLRGHVTGGGRGQPIRVAAHKSLPAFGVTPELAAERLEAFRAQRNQSESQTAHSPQPSAEQLPA
jgi:hypothetical protein